MTKPINLSKRPGPGRITRKQVTRRVIAMVDNLVAEPPARPIPVSRERAIAALAIKNRLLRVLAARCDGFAIDESLGPDGCFLHDRGQAGACHRPPGGHCRIAEQNTLAYFKGKRAAKGATLRKGARA